MKTPAMEVPRQPVRRRRAQRRRQVQPRSRRCSSSIRTWRCRSRTPRAPRGQEQDGREYHFVGEPEFRAKIAAGDFFEWAEVHGNLYGTSRAAIESRIAAGRDVVLEIDWQGALQIKKIFPHAVLIFILPPSWENCASACCAAARTATR